MISRSFSCVSLTPIDTFPCFYDDLYSFPYPEWNVFHQHVQWMFITGLSIGLAVDFLIAFAVSFYLLKGRDTDVPSYVVCYIVFFLPESFTGYEQYSEHRHGSPVVYYQYDIYFNVSLFAIVPCIC